MKKITLVFMASAFTSVMFAQEMKETEVPAAVKTSFSKKFPGVKVTEWEKEGENIEAKFTANKIESSAVFDSKGTFMEHEQEIESSALPKSVMEYCTKNYADHKLAESAKITDANGKVMYEAELKKGNEHFDVLFDNKGNFVKKLETVVGEDDDEK